MANAEVTAFKGLIPAIDARRIQDPYVIDGANFFLGVDGPITGFSRELYVKELLKNPRYLQAFTLDNQQSSLLFTVDAVVEVDWDSRVFIVRYPYVQQSPQFPWTYAFVGGRHYFAKRDFGLLEYAGDASGWRVIDGITTGDGIPSGIASCASAGGRLVVAAIGVLAWSEIDNGRVFTTSTATGAGFQSLGLVNSYTADSIIGVYPVVDGVVTFTRNGILKSQLIDSVTTFRHYRVDTYYSPLNAWCITSLGDGRLVFLTQQGLYTIDVDVPSVWEPLMSEYFRTKLLPKVKLSSEGMFALEYLHTPEWLFLSVAEGGDFGLYTKAYVWSLKSNEWGSFNRPHTSIVDFYVVDAVETGLNAGYCDDVGNLYKYSASTDDLVAPVWASGVVHWDSALVESSYFAEGVLYPAIVETGSEFLAFASTTGYYDYHAQLGVPPVTAALDAFVVVGPFRLRDGEAALEFSHVVNLAVGTTSTAAISAGFEDWLNQPPDFDETDDLMTYSDTVVDDYMLYASDGAPAAEENGSKYIATIHSSIDGVNNIQQVTSELFVVQNENRTIVFAADTTGVYFTVRISAEETGQSFQLKNIELQGNSAGRYR